VDFHVVIGMVVHQGDEILGEFGIVENDVFFAEPGAAVVDERDMKGGFAIAIVQFERWPTRRQVGRESQFVHGEVEAEKRFGDQPVEPSG
jgi:hypothetical protein